MSLKPEASPLTLSSAGNLDDIFQRMRLAEIQWESAGTPSITPRPLPDNTHRLPSRHPPQRRNFREPLRRTEEPTARYKFPVSVEDGDDHGEMKELREIVITKATVTKLPMKKLASVLAAYLVDYDDTMGVAFRMLENCIYTFCENNLIRGAVLVDASEEHADGIINEMVENIAANYGDGSSQAIRSSLKVGLSTFMELSRKVGR